MNYKIIGIALLLASTNIAVPVIDDTKAAIEQKQLQDRDKKQCACYCKKVIEMIKNNNIIEASKLSVQEQERIIKEVCWQNEEKDTKSEIMRQWMMHSMLLE